MVRMDNNVHLFPIESVWLSVFNTIMCETELLLHFVLFLGRVENTPAYQAYLMLGVSIWNTYFQRRRAQKIDYGHPCANARSLRLCYVVLWLSYLLCFLDEALELYELSGGMKPLRLGSCTENTHWVSMAKAPREYWSEMRSGKKTNTKFNMHC